jgi:hypothetical protein
MKNNVFFVLVAAAAPLFAACGDNKADPKTPTTSSSNDPPPTTTTSPDPPASASAEPEPAKKRKPFEIYSTCSDVVTIAFGENAKDPKAGKKTIAPSSTIEGARDNDGNQTVWLLDNNGEPLVKVNVTRGMKRVEIGKSCRTLDAR